MLYEEFGTSSLWNSKYFIKVAKPRNLLMTMLLISRLSFLKNHPSIFFITQLKINHTIDASGNINEKIFFFIIPI